MCGILGIFRLRNARDNRQAALDASRKLRHRGPDWSGVYCEGTTIICHERLAIVGVEDGRQPIFNRDRTVVLGVNGEIYNWKVLKAQLSASHEWQTHSDCEVLLHGYVEHGPAFLQTMGINGMYAFVLYDEKQDRFVAARDPIGIIPLYWGHGADGSTWFSSEMKALADCASYEEFPPGHYFDSNQGGEPVPFYTSPWLDEALIPSAPVTAKQFREALEASVIRHLMADVPYGVLLSGGLDSSLVAAIAARHAPYRTEEYANIPADQRAGVARHAAHFPRLHSFCIGLRGSPDAAAAQRVADFIGTVHHSYEFTIQEGLDALSDVIYHIETYDVTTVRASTPMYLLARCIRATGVKMVLSGEGADEVFGGYLYFHKAPNAAELHRESVRKLKALSKYDCLRCNKAMMAYGVEARVPFLDREFLELSMNLDPALKLCRDPATGEPRMEKHLIRSAFDTEGVAGEQPFLPRDVLWRQKEQFSDGVGYSWIDALRDTAEAAVSDEEFAKARYIFPIGTPTTKEAFMYRRIFAKHFPQECAARCVPSGPSVACSTPTAVLWDAAFQANADPSGRAVAGVHVAAYTAAPLSPATSPIAG